MNYILGENRSQARIECIDDYVDTDSEVRVIDKIIDTLDIESLGFKVGNNSATGRPMYDPKDMLKLFVYGYFNGIRFLRSKRRQARARTPRVMNEV